MFASCGTPQGTEPARPVFHEEDKADIVIRYYSDTVNRILKPKQLEGEFLSTFDIKGTLDLAKSQPGHELAVVILIYFNANDAVKIKWVGLLREIGYHRVVFLRAKEGTEINGLSILEDPPEPARGGKPPQS